MIESVNHAVAGILHAFSSQYNMRVHAFIALLVLMAALVLGASRDETTILALAIGLVMVAEMVNTAIETAVDLVTKRYHPLAQIAKDVAAGAVLVAAATSILIGVLIFFPRLSSLADASFERASGIPEVVTAAALGAVLILVVLVKAEVTPFRIQGGFPSAHAAIAFSLATLIYLSSASGAVAVMGAAVAFLVAQSRVEAKIHSVFEVASGALIGVLVTMLVAQLLSG